MMKIEDMNLEGLDQEDIEDLHNAVYLITFETENTTPRIFTKELKEIKPEGAHHWSKHKNEEILDVLTVSCAAIDWFGCWTGFIREHVVLEKEKDVENWIKEKSDEI